MEFTHSVACLKHTGKLREFQKAETNLLKSELLYHEEIHFFKTLFYIIKKYFNNYNNCF